MAIAADNQPIIRLAAAAFKVVGIDKARQIYSRLMRLEQAFDLKNPTGAVTSIWVTPTASE
jgi:hypothetical protein